MKKNKIQLNIPNLIGNEWKYLKKCIDTNWISTAGKFVDTFEKKISNGKFNVINSKSIINKSTKNFVEKCLKIEQTFLKKSR